MQLEAFTQADGEYRKQTKSLHELVTPMFKKLQRMSRSYVRKYSISWQQLNVGLQIKGSNTVRCEKHTHMLTNGGQFLNEAVWGSTKPQKCLFFCQIKCLLLTNLIYFVLCKRHKANHYIWIAKHFHNLLRQTSEEIMSAYCEWHCQLRLRVNPGFGKDDLTRFT